MTVAGGGGGGSLKSCIHLGKKYVKKNSWPRPGWAKAGGQKTVILSIEILYNILLKIFQIGPFWADWQTPHFFKTARNMEPQIIKMAIFFIKLMPFQFGICSRNCWKFFKLLHYLLIGRPQNCSICGRSADPLLLNSLQYTYNGYIFHKIDPLLIWILYIKLLHFFLNWTIVGWLADNNGQQFGDELVIFS